MNLQRWTIEPSDFLEIQLITLCGSQASLISIIYKLNFLWNRFSILTILDIQSTWKKQQDYIAIELSDIKEDLVFPKKLFF